MSEQAKRLKTIDIDQEDLRSRVIPVLDQWFGKAFFDNVLMRQRRRKIEGGLVLGCPVWGSHIDIFTNYSLPTIMAPRNLEALAGRATIVMCVPHGERDAQDLWTTLRAMEVAYGIDFMLIEITPAMMSLVGKGQHPHNIYPVLGAAQSLLLHVAARTGCGFHMLQSDHVYGPAYFENLQRLALDFKAISHTSISASIETAGPELEKWRDGRGRLVVPDRQLGDIGFRHMHPRSKLSIMNDRPYPHRLPWSHLWDWQGRDMLTIHCWHTNATYMSHELCNRVPGLNLSTLDTQLPWYMTDPPNDLVVAFPEVEDDMCFIELSGADKPTADDPVDFDTFGHRVWGMCGYQDTHMPFMRMKSVVPIETQATFIEAAEIDRQFDEIMAALLEHRDRLRESDPDVAKMRAKVAEMQAEQAKEAAD